MVVGGLIALVLGLLLGERITQWPDLHSLLAMAYLILIGAMVAYSAYGYVLRRARPTLATSYAYVNPVVAVLLGWAIASEPLSLRTMIAAAVIVAAVVLITSHQPRVAPEREKEADAAPRLRERECVGAGD
jgi:drug/metabolite transporter (DMT)-like permease